MAKGRLNARSVQPRFRRDGKELELTFLGARGDDAKIVIDAEAIGGLVKALIKMVEVSKLNTATFMPSDGAPDEYVDAPPMFHATHVRGVNWYETGALGLKLWTLEGTEVQIQFQHDLAKAIVERLTIAANPTKGPSTH